MKIMKIDMMMTMTLMTLMTLIMIMMIMNDDDYGIGRYIFYGLLGLYTTCCD